MVLTHSNTALSLEKISQRLNIAQRALSKSSNQVIYELNKTC